MIASDEHCLTPEYPKSCRQRDSTLWLVQQGLVPLTELPRLLPAERMAPER